MQAQKNAQGVLAYYESVLFKNICLSVGQKITIFVARNKKT